jgi:hypothetical protein
LAEYSLSEAGSDLRERVFAVLDRCAMRGF